MKITTTSLWVSLGVFVWCLFMGVTAISIGVGALFPPANYIAKPFVCLTGDMTYEQVVSKPLPGTTYTFTTWYCTDARSGEKAELDTFPMSLYAGIIYGVLLFLVIAAAYAWTQRNALALARAETGGGHAGTSVVRHSARARPSLEPSKPDSGAMARMQELKQLRAADMISEEEYQAKRAEILKKL